MYVQAVRTTSRSCCSGWGRGRRLASSRSQRRDALTSWKSRRKERAAFTMSSTRHPSARAPGAQKQSSSWMGITPGYVTLLLDLNETGNDSPTASPNARAAKDGSCGRSLYNLEPYIN